MSHSIFAQNIVTNGDFSNGITGWTYGANPPPGSLTLFNAASPTPYANVTIVAVPNISVSQNLTTIAGHTYNLSFVYGASGSTGNFKFSTNGGSSYTTLLNAPVVRLGAPTPGNTGNAFASYAGTFTAASTTTGLSFASVTSNIYFTNVSVIDAGAPTPPPSGPSLENTQAAVANSAQALQSTYALQNSVLANSFAYDCAVFGANNVCVSGGARNTGVSAANGLNNTSALLIAAYRALPSVRIGAYADQNLSVNNGGSTVNLGNNTPLIGLFAAWNERQDGTGSEVKVSAAYGQKNTTINRGVVGSGSTASEAGSGSSQLNSQGFQLLGKHGFGVMQDVVVSPYVGIRYTQNNMGGYTEGASASVTAPLTYSALNTNATTALAGVGASYRGIPKTNLFASAGIESDTNTSAGSYSATGVSGLTPVNFNANPVKNRAAATVGATYDVEKNQRLGVTGIYRQESYQAVSTTTVMATYTVGF